MKRESWFRLIAIAIPFVALIAVELGLRSFGYGKSVPLFIENPIAKDYLLPEPKIVSRYFATPEMTPSVTIEPNFFLRQKPQDGIRIFVQGGSTAAGFPYGLGASLAGMLDFRLKQTFPNHTVEVVNTALSAVNSYTLLDLADEIIAQQPDAVLIYAGHNEYLGILGVGSAYSAANSRAATLLFLKLKELRLFQLLQNTYWYFMTPDQQQTDTRSRTMMAKVAKHKAIDEGSELFQQGLEQFEGNMALLIAKYRKANIPVFISTIASNLADQAPFSSKPANPANQALLDLPVTDYTDAKRAELELAVKSQPDNANLWYQLGKVLLANNLYEEAERAFVQAKQHDLLRFRAPEQINEIIFALAQQDGVYLVDSVSALKSVAQNGIIGGDLMLEHLHPNTKGYFYIADAFYKGLQESKLLGEFSNPIGTLEAKITMPILPPESYLGDARIAALKADYPFTKTPQVPQIKAPSNWAEHLGKAMNDKQLDWLKMAQQTAKQAQQQNDTTLLVKSLALLADAQPYEVRDNFNAASAYIQIEQSALALRFLRRVQQREPNNINVDLAFAHAFANLGEFENALASLHKVLQKDPNNQTALTNIAAIKNHLIKIGR